jgi:hypothetical protein
MCHSCNSFDLTYYRSEAKGSLPGGSLLLRYLHIKSVRKSTYSPDELKFLFSYIRKRGAL